MIGAPSWVATGARKISRLSPGVAATSAAHADHSKVKPRRNRKPLPASAGVLGSLLNAASLSWRRIAILPRLLTSLSSVPLPRAASIGRNTGNSALNSTRPRSLRGASFEIGDRRIGGGVRIEREHGAPAQLFIGADDTELGAGREGRRLTISSRSTWRMPARRSRLWRELVRRRLGGA